jgi:hypothetical protein
VHGRHPFARILPQVPWSHLPLLPSGVQSRGEWRFRSACRPDPCERAWCCGFAMNQGSRFNLHFQQIAPNARISEKRNIAMSWRDFCFRLPIDRKNSKLQLLRSPCAIQFPRGYKPAAPSPD